MGPIYRGCVFPECEVTEGEVHIRQDTLMSFASTAKQVLVACTAGCGEGGDMGFMLKSVINYPELGGY